MTRKSKIQGGSSLKICVIGDEDTVTGMLMAGIGARDGLGTTNFLMVTSKTSKVEIEDKFKEFVERRDCGVVIITQKIADEIRFAVDSYNKILPTILEIPSKDTEYDPEKDSIMRRVRLFFGGKLPEE